MGAMNTSKTSDLSKQTTAKADAYSELTQAQHALWDEIERHRKTKHALKELEEIHYRILESLNCGIMLSGQEGKILSVNSRLEEISGYTAEELRNKGLLPLLPNATNREELLRIYNTFDRVKDWEIPLKRKDGSTCIVVLHIDRMEIDGRKIQVACIEDITSQKSLEEQLLKAKKMEETGVLARGIAHDFNNLLNVITGYGELILEDPSVNSSVRDDIKQIVESGKEAARLTSQLLELTRKQSP